VPVRYECKETVNSVTARPVQDVGIVDAVSHQKKFHYNKGEKKMGTNYSNNPKCGKCGNFHDLFADCPQIDKMVDRFLSWPLPKDFAPDCGISFDGRKDDEPNKNKTWPVGTNLLTA
jgi:hypothetical protein